MSILDMISEHKSETLYNKRKKEAVSDFIKQKKAIDGIKNTSGFQEIIKYHEQAVSACHERLRTIKSSDIKRLQGELDASMLFLTFLNNTLLQDFDKEDLDILDS